MSIVRVIDFETSGTAPPEAEVCEVGICDFNLETNTISPPQSWFCSVRTMPPEVRAVHHISLNECAGKPGFDANTMLPSHIGAVAAHNAAFECLFFTTPMPVICTHKAALRVWPDAPSHSNGALRYWLEDQGKVQPDHALTQPAHRAGPDAYVTAHLLLALRNEGATWREMIAWTQEPALLPRCLIGKFRGKPWQNVEAGFLGWMLRQPDMDADLRWNAQREINRREGEAA